MPQNIAGKKAWVKMYRKRGQYAKADALEREIKKLETPKMLSRPQMQNRMEKELAKKQGRVTSRDRLAIIHGLYGKPGETPDQVRKRLGLDKNGNYITALFGMSDTQKKTWWRKHRNR